MRIKSIKKVILATPKQYYDVIEATPYNNFLIKTNSGYIVSHNCNMSDEVNFSGMGNSVEKNKIKLSKMIAQIDARMISRFGKGAFLPTLNIIISSKDTDQSFLDSYINTKQENESQTTLIIDEPQWVVRNDKGTPGDPGSFYVAIGNKFLAHELLPLNADEELVESYRSKGYSMLLVPPAKGFREAFETNLDQALMDMAGLSSASATKYISGVRLNQTKVDTYKNPFTKDVITVGNAEDDYTQYANFFDLSRVSAHDISRPLFIHLDMSVSGDKTGIAGVWITGKRPTVDGDDSSRSLNYKLAFSVSVAARNGYQISFEKTRNFIYWLKERGFAIKNISADTYMSAPVLQELQSAGFKTNILSVDRITSSESLDKNGRVIKQCIPYAFLKTTIYERHIEIYQKCDLLTEELIGLERKADGHIDHTKEGVNSKDQADAVCGALYSASLFSERYSYDYGDTLDTIVEVNDALDVEQRKADLIAMFEQDLTQIYTEIQENDNAITKHQKDEYQYYQDLADGIIVI